MNIEDCFYFGLITKAHGLKGEVDVFMDVDDPSHYFELDAVFVNEKGKLIPYFIEHIEKAGKGHFKFKLEDISSIEETQHLIKKELYLPLTVLPKLDGNKFYFHEIIEFHVIDQQHGDIGQIKRVIDNTGNPLLEVFKDEVEILIPILDDIIIKVDREHHKLHINAPEGLIELYLNIDED